MFFQVSDPNYFYRHIHRKTVLVLVLVPFCFYFKNYLLCPNLNVKTHNFYKPKICLFLKKYRYFFILTLDGIPMNHFAKYRHHTSKCGILYIFLNYVKGHLFCPSGYLGGSRTVQISLKSFVISTVADPLLFLCGSGSGIQKNVHMDPDPRG